MNLKKTAGWKENLDAILKHSVYSQEENLIDVLLDLQNSGGGTKIVLFNLSKVNEVTDEFELDFDDPTDIKLRHDYQGEESEFEPVAPSYRYSLKEYCCILYRVPRMKIFIRKKAVRSLYIEKSLSNTGYFTYMFGRKEPTKIMIGLCCKSSSKSPVAKNYGLMLYNKKRLITAYKKIGIQLGKSPSALGAVVVAEVNHLTPIHNKQEFREDRPFINAMRVFREKLKAYWETMEPKIKEESHTKRRKPDWTWVQCDKCNKWRRLPEWIDPSNLPEKWYCYMNSDINHSSCEDPEEHEHVDEMEIPKKSHQGRSSSCKKGLGGSVASSTRTHKPASDESIAPSTLTSQHALGGNVASSTPTSRYASGENAASSTPTSGYASGGNVASSTPTRQHASENAPSSHSCEDPEENEHVDEMEIPKKSHQGRSSSCKKGLGGSVASSTRTHKPASDESIAPSTLTSQHALGGNVASSTPTSRYASGENAASSTPTSGYASGGNVASSTPTRQHASENAPSSQVPSQSTTPSPVVSTALGKRKLLDISPRRKLSRRDSGRTNEETGNSHVPIHRPSTEEKPKTLGLDPPPAECKPTNLDLVPPLFIKKEPPYSDVDQPLTARQPESLISDQLRSESEPENSAPKRPRESLGNSISENPSEAMVRLPKVEKGVQTDDSWCSRGNNVELEARLNTFRNNVSRLLRHIDPDTDFESIDDNIENVVLRMITVETDDLETPDAMFE